MSAWSAATGNSGGLLAKAAQRAAMRAVGLRYVAAARGLRLCVERRCHPAA